MKEEHYAPIEDVDEPDAALESEILPDGPALVTCVSCGHPNLEFRNHCRKCGFPLQGASNILPGVEYLEWTSTDGAARKAQKRPRQAALIFTTIAVFAAMFLILRPRIAAVLFGLACGIGLALGIAKRLTGEHLGPDVLQKAGEEASESAGSKKDLKAVETEDACPECGGPIQPCDDICPGCGAIVGL